MHLKSQYDQSNFYTCPYVQFKVLLEKNAYMHVSEGSEIESLDERSEENFSAQREPSTESCCPRQHGVCTCSFSWSKWGWRWWSHLWDPFPQGDIGCDSRYCFLGRDLCGVWVHTYCAFHNKCGLTKILMQWCNIQLKKKFFIIFSFISLYDCYYCFW